MNDMTPRELWIEALESGRYKQARGALEHPKSGGYCCLGVLCRVAMENGVPVEREERHSEVLYDGESACLPDSVLEWAGVRAPIGVLSDKGRSRHRHVPTLVTANDTRGLSFAEIAEIIKDDDAGLFVDPEGPVE